MIGRSSGKRSAMPSLQNGANVRLSRKERPQQWKRRLYAIRSHPDPHSNRSCSCLRSALISRTRLTHRQCHLRTTRNLKLAVNFQLQSSRTPRGYSPTCLTRSLGIGPILTVSRRVTANGWKLSICCTTGPGSDPAISPCVSQDRWPAMSSLAHLRPVKPSHWNGNASVTCVAGKKTRLSNGRTSSAEPTKKA